MAEDEVHTQRLYLSRGDNEVYVDTIALPQHQLDGIRFLYHQFVKRKSGVILNDPPGYGKRVQAVLFISAIRPLLKLPILILCAEGQELLWRHLFLAWTNMETEVTIQMGSTATMNPMCHISTVPYLKTFERREWSVLVVDEHHAAFKLLDSRLKADYRIWISSSDMKSRLPTFALIYTWLFPKENFFKEDFLSPLKTPRVVLTKSARLDAFMEDIVLRRKGVTLPLGKCEEIIYKAQASRKNKDSTGKKIKRSKHNHGNGLNSSEAPVSVSAKATKMDVEIKNDTNEVFKVFDTNNIRTEMDIDTGNKELTTNIGTKRIKYNHRNDNETTNDTKIKDEEDKSDPVDIDGDRTDDALPEPSVLNIVSRDDKYELLNNNEIDSQNIVIKYDSDTPDDDEIKNDNRETNNTSKVSKSEELVSSDIKLIDIKSDDKVIDHNINDKIDNSDCKKNVIHSEDLFSEDLPSNEVKNEVVIKTDDINRNKNEIVNKNNVSENNKTDVKLEGVELKMQQMEELAMKKFKGSFLDNIF